MDNQARHSCLRFAPLLAALVVLAGCKTQWDRWNDHYLGPDYDPVDYADGARAISLMRPGQTRVEEAQKLLGATLKPHEPGLPQPGECVRLGWGPGWKSWNFEFSNDGVLVGYSRAFIGNLGMFFDNREADEFHRWYVSNLAKNAAPPERAAGFAPGITTQEVVFAAWGPAISARVTEEGSFDQCWGSNWDNWTLQFDAAGVLASAPRHYQDGVNE